LRYKNKWPLLRFQTEVAQLVAVGFGGSLKAEHGTGRNMAPFVSWNGVAALISADVWSNACSTPKGILNPDGVVG
jgi:D-lactate dehydrogenase